MICNTEQNQLLNHKEFQEFNWKSILEEAIITTRIDIAKMM